ncbi:MAG: mannose-1-phosphate guanylyltransferase/mannose-6-phosphate isomerase [Oscillospiraceae bacterium]|jgi:mannose-1-phosphate guanylyltransferase/mannose-6-phosphate isomerase|nr:mannose-1-phosphate guanylyltransferase/mannose-6-phosphate isomerase [Oscillospiraceae bacterium]
MKVIILCGGSGSRLWPLSRTNYPKQFLRLANMSHSIFQMTLQRALMLCPLEDVLFVTSETYKHLIYGQMEEMGFNPVAENVLFEPMAKNTLPAICYGVKKIRQDADDVAVVFSSDHLIDNEAMLAKTIESAVSLTQEHMVIFGIKPDSPETVYGYIKPDKPCGVGFTVEAFKEKPDFETAKEYVKQGYLWNSGMFMFNTAVFTEEVRKHNPEVYNAFIEDDINICFEKTPSVSIDYGLMEKSSINAVLPMSVGWNDLGNFIAFYDKYHTNQDADRNVHFYDEIILDGKDNLVYSNGDKAIAVVGLSNVVVIDQKDALLICERGSTAKVGEVVKTLKENDDKRADYHLTEYTSWGSLTSLEDTSQYKVKRLTLPPGKAIPTQMHYHRNEHWIVVNGTAVIEIEGEEKILRGGESIFVNSGVRHRLENRGKVLLEVIEVQSGGYWGEDVVYFNND